MKPTRQQVLLLLLILLSVLLWGFRFSGRDNGFDLDNSLVPQAEIHAGGPAKDGIPAIDRPLWIAAADATFLDNDARVLGLDYRGKQRAYPIQIMNWHEIVNDTVVGKRVLITFCPLCGTGMAFEVAAADEVDGFGVSGLLYNSDMLLYDRSTDSLWSQIERKAISGPRVGEHLQQIPLQVTSWADWRRRYPATRVLSRKTGYSRDYDRDPYAGYSSSSSTYFPVPKVDPRYHPKEQVIGLMLDGQARVWPFAELSKLSSPVTDRFAGRSLLIHFDAANRSARISDSEGRLLPATTGFWFAWMAFHPDSSVYQAGSSGKTR